MNIFKTKECRHYEKSRCAIIVSLKGSFSRGSKCNPMFFAGTDYHGISRYDAARTLRRWRKENEIAVTPGANGKPLK